MASTQEKVWKCSTCSKTLSSKRNLTRHTLTHDPAAKVKCQICGKFSKNAPTLSKHIRVLHTDQKRSSCDICHRVFLTRSNLSRHIDTAHSTIKPPRLPCGFPECGKTYANRDSLSIHIKTEHAENPTRFRCTLCGKELKSRRHLEIHIPTHTTEKAYICPTCGRSFSYSSSLKRHEATHLEKSIRPIFKCELCPQISLSRSVLQKHIQVVHENRKNYPCTFCDKRFSRSANMRRHVEAKHPANKEKIHSCDKCEFVTHAKRNLTLHARRHNPANLRECYFCKKQFFYFSELAKHCRRHTLEWG